MNRAIRMKLFGTIISLIVAATLAVTVTFAWYVLNKKAEISNITVTLASTGKEYPFELSYDGENWSTELHINLYKENSETKTYADLRPISTKDLLHWYLPTYFSGNVSGFYLVADASDTDLPIARISNQSPEKQNGEYVRTEESSSNYIISFDIYVRTRDKDATYALRLNNPGTENGTINVQEEETVFGTYVLPVPREGLDSENKNYTGLSASNTNLLLDYGAASIRIGFAMFDEAAELEGEIAGLPSSETDLIGLLGANTLIYEPNADLRSNFASSGYYTDERTSLTYRLSGDSDDDNSSAFEQVSSYSGASGDSTIYSTFVPTWQSDGSYTLTRQETLRQTQSTWSEERLSTLDSLGELNSNYIGSLGSFLSSRTDITSVNPETDYVENDALPIMAKIRYNVKNASGTDILKDGQPVRMVQKIRVYIWIEGQDVDCWNQIAGKQIYANFEFRGDDLTSSH